jgi:hypothetical protein
MWNLHPRPIAAAVVVASLLGAESGYSYGTFAPLDPAIFIANADGINERELTRVLLRAGDRVSEQQHGEPDLRPVVLLIHDNTRPAVPEPYPLLLVSADDSKVPPGGVALAMNGDLPSNLVAPQILQPVLSRMWKQSRTFRRQCGRIDAVARLMVRVYIGATFSQSGGRAATYIHGGSTGLKAEVYVASRTTDLIELIAHEFEHIIEQLDGLDLPRLARLAPVTVWATRDRGFETQRATETGRLVAAEVEDRAR